jgi:predicted transcriptional regulator
MAKAAKSEGGNEQEKERTTIYLRKDLYKKVKYVAFKEESNNTAVIEQALEDFFGKYEKKNGEIKL